MEAIQDRSKSGGEDQRDLYQANERTEGNTPDQDKKKKMIIGGAIGAAVLIGIILIIVFATGGSDPNPGPSPVNPAYKHYNPYKLEGTVTNTESAVEGVLKGSFPGHEVLLSEETELLQQIGAAIKPENLEVDLEKIPTGVNNKPVKEIAFSFSMVDFSTAKLEIGEKDSFSIPSSVVNKPEENKSMRLDMMNFNLNESPFYFNFTDKQNPDQAWVTTQDATLLFADKYIQMDFTLPSWDLYGFGERVHKTNMTQGAWTMWNKDLIPIADDGFGKGRQSSGMHPFILFKNPKSNNFGGMFFRNANNAAPIVVFNVTDGTTDVSYITTGGKLEVYFFLDGTPEEIIQRYQASFGSPTLPPFWALGWQQSSDSYNTAVDIQDVVTKSQAADLPLDAVWMSHGANNDGMPFSVNNGKFMNIPKDMSSITTWKMNFMDKNDVKLVTRQTPAFGYNMDNELWKQFFEQQALIKSTIHTDVYGSYLTTDTTTAKQAQFPDFMTDAAQELWFDGLDGYASQVDFDGISIENDGPYTTCDGECPGTTPPPSPPALTACPPLEKSAAYLLAGETIYSWYASYADQSKQSTYELPFSPGEKRGKFDSQTVSLNATVYETSTKTNYQMWNMHNLYGLQAAQATFNSHKNHEFLLSDKRPFVVSQSTFGASSGQYAAHPSAPVDRTVDWLRFSVASVLQMNMFSVPMSGVDVCGTFGKQDEQLCAVWTQLAAFLPLARNNYISKDGNNEFYNIKDKDAMAMVKTAMQDRLRIARYMYTSLFDITQSGGTLVKPMFFYFPSDPDAYFDLEQDFMIGDSLKVSPALGMSTKKGEAFTYTSYFPTKDNEAWVNIFDFSDRQMTTVDDPKAKVKTNQRNKVTAGAHTNVYLRPGAIVPMQMDLTFTDANNKPATASNTVDLIEQLPVDLIVNLDTNGEAKGSILIDDGSSQSMLDNQMYDHWSFQYSAGSLKKEWKTNASGMGGLPDSVKQENRVLNSIVLVNVPDTVNIDFACLADQKMNTQDLKKVHDAKAGTYTFTTNTKKQLRFYSMSALYFGDSRVDSNLCQTSTREWKAVSMPDLKDVTQVQFLIEPTDPAAVPQNNIQVTITLLEKPKGQLYSDLKVEMTLYHTAGYEPYVPEHVVSADLKQAAIGSLFERVNIIPGGSKVKGEENFVLEILSYSDMTTPIWSSADHPLYLSEFLTTWGGEMVTMKEDAFTGAFGLGERVDDFMLKDGTYSFWNRDNPNDMENGQLPGKNNYGTHPFMAWQTSMGTFASSFVNNAAANDVIISNDATNGMVSFDQIFVGGNMEIYFSETETPNDLSQMYQSKVGYPVLVPQWLLGWNQCRYGYKDTKALQDVVAGYKAAGLGLDVMWNDIDYLDNYQDFTVDPTRYADLGSFVKNTLHKNRMQYIPIIDAGIAYAPDSGYATFDEGVKQKAFIMDYTNKTPFIGKVWPGDAVFVDWTAKNAQSFWSAGLDMLEKEVSFDGLWLDMNEASNFCDGACFDDQTAANPVKFSAPYWPTGRDLSIKSLDLDAMHANGKKELDMHNVFALGEVKATHEWFMAKKQRTAIISRSSFAGQGKYGSRWLGDNFSDVNDMALSVPGIMSMNMFGIPVIGADICGFIGDTTPELCARWYKLGAFYPFARNHNALGSIDQEPYQEIFNVEYKNATVAKTTYRDIIYGAIKERYNYIPYLYSNVLSMNMKGGSYFKPVFFEFPNDPMTYADNQNNFMLGSHLKVSMSTSDLYARGMYFYFPKGSWCPLWNTEEDCITTDDGERKYMKASADISHVHLRQGSIVPTADAQKNTIMNVVDMRDFPLDLHVSPSKNLFDNHGMHGSSGSFFTDNGVSMDSMDITKGSVNEYEFVVTGSSGARFELIFKHYAKASQFLNKADGCFKTSMNDYLGEISIHNSKQLNIMSDKFEGTIVFNNGKTQTISNKDFSYVLNKNKDKLVLNIAQQFVNDDKGVPTKDLLCLGNIQHITFAEEIPTVETASMLFE